MERSRSARARRPRCPRCGTAVEWSGNSHRPFCSLTCRLVDLGVWLDERYRVAGDPLPADGGVEDRVPAGGG
ncbi:MAG TPA: DNA gyrase inhibitor YacG [Methylomirabilota bacterium]|nr:DNA gyrase inhibitor YacG [Methylomirabilota bacterium]